MESYRERVSLAAVIVPNESLCQTNSKGLKVLSQTAVGPWLEILLQDESVNCAAKRNQKMYLKRNNPRNV